MCGCIYDRRFGWNMRLLLLMVVSAPFCAGATRTMTNRHDGQVYVWIPPGTYVAGCSQGDTDCFTWEPAPRENACGVQHLDRADGSNAMSVSACGWCESKPVRDSSTI
jgi:hypothetical protein